MEQEIKNLLHNVTQLCSDVESSTAGREGAHRQAIARVRKNMREVETALNPKWDGKTHTGSCGSPYGSSCPCGN